MDDRRIIGAGAGDAFEDGADRGRVLVSGHDTGGRYALMEWTVAPRPAGQAVAYGPHRHFELEETFCIRVGHLEFLLDETVTTLGPGDVVRAPPGIRHGYANTSGGAVEMLVGFHPGGFEALFLKHRTDQPDPPPAEAFIEEATRLHTSAFET